METLIDRREAIRKTAMMLGVAVSSSALMSILESCRNTPALNYKPVFFTEDQALLISQAAEIIIPRTDTPGATDVGVSQFIDLLVKNCYKEEDQKLFLDGMKEFDEMAIRAFGDRFVEGSPEEQVKYLKQVHDDAVNAEKAKPSTPRPFILKLKQLTMFAFFTSEPGATKVLQYNQVPGAYHGCVPLSEAGKTWA
jgi:gluconate 2-dehydrogenase gamma chain